MGAESLEGEGLAKGAEWVGGISSYNNYKEPRKSNKGDT